MLSFQEGPGAVLLPAQCIYHGSTCWKYGLSCKPPSTHLHCCSADHTRSRCYEPQVPSRCCLWWRPSSCCVHCKVPSHPHPPRHQLTCWPPHLLTWQLSCSSKRRPARPAAKARLPRHWVPQPVPRALQPVHRALLPVHQVPLPPPRPLLRLQPPAAAQPLHSSKHSSSCSSSSRPGRPRPPRAWPPCSPPPAPGPLPAATWPRCRSSTPRSCASASGTGAC